jgi:hypothetical protein
MAEPSKTSSVQLPTAQRGEVIWVRLPGGRLVPRAPHELEPRPSTPAPAGK